MLFRSKLVNSLVKSSLKGNITVTSSNQGTSTRLSLIHILEAAKVINEEKLAGFIIILTAYRDKDIAKQAVDIDVMGYIVKPVDEDVLIPAIEIALNKYRQIKKMEKEFDKTKEALDDRKYVDRAKGLLMERRKMTEKEAYVYIRKLAMDKGNSMVEIAKTPVSYTHLAVWPKCRTWNRYFLHPCMEVL